MPGIQTSRHVQQQWARPVPTSVWKTLKGAGLPKPTRGKRAGRFATNCHRIKTIHSVFRGDIFQPISAIRLSEANRSLGHNHNTVTNSNNIIVHREPLEPPPSTSKPMLFTVLNSQSVRNKTLSVKDFTVESDIDVLAFTETWLSDESDEYIIRDLCPTGYEFYIPRGSRGGGVGLYKKRIRFQKQSRIKAKFRSFEFTDLLLRQDSTSLRVIIVYCPQTVDNRSTEPVFFQEFPSLLEKLAIAAGSLLMVGDFNFHVEDCNDRSAQRFLQLLETFNMEQHIREPTHRSGHTLDLMITRAEENIASNFSVHDPAISDHFAVSCTLALRKVPFERKRLYYRKLKSIDVLELRADIANSSLMNDDVEDVTVLMDNYNSVLSSLLDKHAP